MGPTSCTSWVLGALVPEDPLVTRRTPPRAVEIIDGPGNLDVVVPESMGVMDDARAWKAIGHIFTALRQAHSSESVRVA